MKITNVVTAIIFLPIDIFESFIPLKIENTITKMIIDGIIEKGKKDKYTILRWCKTFFIIFIIICEFYILNPLYVSQTVFVKRIKNKK